MACDSDSRDKKEDDEATRAEKLVDGGVSKLASGVQSIRDPGFRHVREGFYVDDGHSQGDVANENAPY